MNMAIGVNAYIKMDISKPKEGNSMITIGISKWPTESGLEIGKRFFEMKPMPDFVKMKGPYLYPDEDEGITGITIFKYDKEKAGDAADAIANGFVTFNGIKGYRYSIWLASGASTTMKMMGIE